MPMDFDILLEKFLKEDLSPEELSLFLAAAKEAANDEVLQRKIAEKLNKKEYHGLSDPAKIPSLFRAMLEKASREQVSLRNPEGGAQVTRRRFLIRRMRVAAVLLLVAAGAYLLWSTVRQSQPPDVAPNSAESRLENDIAPGGNKAVLTLANGEKITLDSAADGQLARQGNSSIIKLATGHLTYKNTSATDKFPEPYIATPMAFNTLSTPRGGQYQLTLPDGSRVWLNAASSIRYPTAFSGKERKVEISGEVYFEVSKNADMPFRVTILGGTTDQTSPLEIQVLGTSFNVMAYEDDSTVSTTLLEGGVKIIKGATARMITPGQQLITNARGGMHLAANVDMKKVIAWKNGKFIFYNDYITDIMKQLTRWYDIDVRFTGEVHDHYSGGISRQVNISQVLKMLEAAGGVSFSVRGKEVRIN